MRSFASLGELRGSEQRSLHLCVKTMLGHRVSVSGALIVPLVVAYTYRQSGA
jgi:hypothetical protein